MKFVCSVLDCQSDKVASFAEAWIEINFEPIAQFKNFVASFAEAWIEICTPATTRKQKTVASFAEAWIEILTRIYLCVEGLRRLLRGGVD